ARIHTLSLHDALPILICARWDDSMPRSTPVGRGGPPHPYHLHSETCRAGHTARLATPRTRGIHHDATTAGRVHPGHGARSDPSRSEEHTSELQSRFDL